ncbi:MAG TPA: cupin domain-containing protein [Noviherbaspirillum sp.]|nr:cupin domain-containing protein [Noviherbaspirillum sp.]
MSQHHPAPGELIDIRPLEDRFGDAASIALARTDDLEVMRVVMQKGKTIPTHSVPGELTLQCLEGTVEVQALGRTQPLLAGQMIYLLGNTPYALSASENSSLLMTVLRKENMKY